MKKTLCFVITSMHRDGAERVMSLIVNASARMGYETHLILLSDPTVDYALDERVNVIKISELIGQKTGRLSSIYKRYAILKKKIIDINPDAVLSFLTMCNIYTAFALRKKKIPVIVSERNDPGKECSGKIRRLVRRIAYRYADGFVFQTNDARAYFSKKIQKRSTVIPNPVKNDLPYAQKSEKENKIVAAARLSAQKNYPLMLRAFKRFACDYPDYKLHIYGDGNLKESLIALSQELNISEKVAFEGNVIDLHERIKDAKMFVLSSDYEGISNSLLEAMAMGLPCISTDCPCGGSRMLIEDGVSGLLTPVGDEAAFYRAMKKLAENEELAQTVSNNALKAREIYSEKTILKKYFDYFDLILQYGDKK